MSLFHVLAKKNITLLYMNKIRVNTANIKYHVDCVLQYRVVQDLVNNINKKMLGVFEIKDKDSPTATWCEADKTIRINTSKCITFGQICLHIIFELHNALSQNLFKIYDDDAKNGKINRSEYIESIEKEEYQNLMRTNEVIRIMKDVEYSGLILSSFVVPQWIDHFRIQKKWGHVGHISRMYDILMADSDILPDKSPSFKRSVGRFIKKINCNGTFDFKNMSCSSKINYDSVKNNS